ncbi:MAG: hypothetical protein ACYCS1_05360 [Gammaproteobacteria bacterium]
MIKGRATRKGYPDIQKPIMSYPAILKIDNKSIVLFEYQTEIWYKTANNKHPEINHNDQALIYAGERFLNVDGSEIYLIDKKTAKRLDANEISDKDNFRIARKHKHFKRLTKKAWDKLTAIICIENMVL